MKQRSWGLSFARCTDSQPPKGRPNRTGREMALQPKPSARPAQKLRLLDRKTETEAPEIKREKSSQNGVVGIGFDKLPDTSIMAELHLNRGFQQFRSGGGLVISHEMSNLSPPKMSPPPSPVERPAWSPGGAFFVLSPRLSIGAALRSRPCASPAVWPSPRASSGSPADHPPEDPLLPFPPLHRSDPRENAC